jgi:putative DNA primase/helicase
MAAIETLAPTRRGGKNSDLGPRVFVNPARDMSKLDAALEQIGDVALLIVDPVVSAVPEDSHKSADARRALQPLVDRIGRRNIATIGITHFSKGTARRDPTERIIGSIAFGALAHVVLVADAFGNNRQFN